VPYKRPERRDRLRRLARPLKPAVAPYYLHRPLSESEPAPGWYWTPAGLEHPVYLGYSVVDAEISLRRALALEEAAERD
jgi:hypothetical protein